MMTHVKRNSQKIRTAYIKPSRIEAAVHFRNQAEFPTYIHSHKNSRENIYYSREREIQVSKLNEYIRKLELYFPSPSVSRF